MIRYFVVHFLKKAKKFYMLSIIKIQGLIEAKDVLNYENSRTENQGVARREI